MAGARLRWLNGGGEMTIFLAFKPHSDEDFNLPAVCNLRFMILFKFTILLEVFRSFLMVLSAFFSGCICVREKSV